MDDREIAEILRKRNMKYVKHLKETTPHSEHHDTLEGGFIGALAAAARIAARAAIRATTQAAKEAAKLAAKAAKAGAKQAKVAAKAAKNAAKKVKQGVNLQNLDRAATLADVGQVANNIAQELLKKAKSGEVISEEEWKELDELEKVEVDFVRWSRALNKNTYDLFKQRGGTLQAARETARLLSAGLDPDDWVANQIDAKYETIVEGIQELDDMDPADDDECLDLLDIDDRSQAEIIGLEALSLVDFGIGQAISEKKLEERQRSKYDSCVRRKTKEIDDTRAGLMAQMGLGPNDEFDADDLSNKAFIADTLAAKNPIFKAALATDGARMILGLPRVDEAGTELSPEKIEYNDMVEKIMRYFVENQTIEYDDVPWIVSEANKDPTIVPRAIARLSTFPTAYSQTPESKAFIEYWGADTKKIGQETAAITEWLNDPDMKNRIIESKNYTIMYDDKEIAQQVTDEFVSNRDYVPGNMVRYKNKVYKCILEQKKGENKPDPDKWEEISLYNQEDLDVLKNIGSATPYEPHIEYPEGAYVLFTYMDRQLLFLKLKDTPAGVPPMESSRAGMQPNPAWEEINLNNGDLIYMDIRPERKWNADKEYKVGDAVFWNVDLQKYRAILDSKNVLPSNTQYWRKIITFNIDDELARRLKIEQRVAMFASINQVSENFDPDTIYQLNDVVIGYDANYYQLIKEKKNKDGEVIAPPIPPNKTYWKLISDGVTTFDPNNKYKLNDFTLYEKVYYVCINENTPIGTLPTDTNYWEPLDPLFEDLDPEIIKQNTENFYQGIMNRSEEYNDDVTSSYQIGDIVKEFDNDGYPQFYECIKDILVAKKADDEDIRKAEPYNNSKAYDKDAIVSLDGVIYKKKINDIAGIAPSDSTKWTILGYEKDPGPPNPEFWKDYTLVDSQEEKYEKIRDSAKNGNKDLNKIFVNDIVKDPATDLYYKLILDPEIPISNYPMYGIPDWGTKEYFTRILTQYNTPEEAEKKLNDPFWTGFYMPQLRTFDNKKTEGYYQGKENLSRVLMWEPLIDVPTELEARLANTEDTFRYNRNKLYKRDDIVIDKYGLKYLCIKDTPKAGMEPYYNQIDDPNSVPPKVAYFVELDEDSWDTAINTAREVLEQQEELSQRYDDITFTKAEWNKPRKWGEVVRYKEKFYKFFAYNQAGDGTYVPIQQEPGVLGYAMEWCDCDANGNLKIILDTDYGEPSSFPYAFIYSRGGPIFKIKDKYYVVNMLYKEIFGLGGPDDSFAIPGQWYGFWSKVVPGMTVTESQGDTYPPDLLITEVYKDGKPKFKHDATTGAIIGENADVSDLPKATVKAMEEVIDKNEQEMQCPTADDDDEDEDTHHEEVQAEKDLEQAMIEWKAKGSIPEDDPRLLQGQEPEVGTASGINIEELDGTQYHKKKRVYRKKK